MMGDKTEKKEKHNQHKMETRALDNKYVAYFDTAVSIFLCIIPYITLELYVVVAFRRLEATIVPLK